MTEQEFNAAATAGKVTVEADAQSDDTTSTSSTLPTTPIDQFIPLLTQLSGAQVCLTSAPTFVPQTFQEQIQFVFTGGDYYLYLYFNGGWHSFSVSATPGVTQILAGTGIIISPSGGTGTVTISAESSGVTSVTTLGAGISASPNTGGVVLENTGVTSLVAGDNVSVSGSTGAVTVSATGNSFAVGTGTIADTGSLSFTTTPQNHDTVVTHGLGTTPKLITITINQMMVGGDSGGAEVNEYVFLYLTFNASGTPVSGFTNYYFDHATSLVNGGLTTSFTNAESPVSGTMSISLVSINSTTFTFRVTYSQNTSGFTTLNGSANGISYLCQG